MRKMNQGISAEEEENNLLTKRDDDFSIQMEEQKEGTAAKLKGMAENISWLERCKSLLWPFSK